MNRNHRIAAAAASALALLSGCYGTDLDSDIDGIYVCDVDRDCALGTSCSDGVCRDLTLLQGPSLRVLDPLPLSVFPVGETASIPLTIAGEYVTLANGASDEADAGYIEVLLDGALVDTITEGDLEDGVSLDSIIAPTDPGLHHIGLVARRLDGEIFPGETSSVATAFWIDDGREHVGILSPAPGVKVALESQELSIEIASLNFTLVNPGFISPDEVDDIGAGYVHLYVDAEVPNCIPECNFEHQSVLAPAGLSRVNRMVVERAVLLPGDLGTARIQIVAQNFLQQPYYREGDVTQLVFHQVPVQSIVEVAP